MLTEVKRCADQGDIMGLRYIFVDSLDVDPTFESYLEEYEYCKSVNGLFDEHRELSPLLSDQTQWTLPYWDQLKIDLMNNFSQRRFEHMIVVARIVHADKVARMMAKQQRMEQTRRGSEENGRRTEENQCANRDRVKAKESAPQNSPSLKQSTLSESEKQRQNIEQKKRSLEEKNRKAEENRREQQKQVEKSKERYGGNQNAQDSGTGSKKAPGLALAVLAAVVVILVIAMLLGRSPR